MTDQHTALPVPRPKTPKASAAVHGDDAHQAPGHSMWWMVACCAPMILLALAILLGVFGPR